jgi:hypothetical protein
MYTLKFAFREKWTSGDYIQYTPPNQHLFNYNCTNSNRSGLQMSRELLIQALKSKTPQAFIEHYLYDRIPNIFGGDRQSFINWRRTLSEKIEVDQACITIVGSAATGISLSPYKNFKAFDNRSDIDVAVVSPHHFSLGWRYLRMNGLRRLRVDQRTRIAWDEHVNKYIYWGTIATDKLLGVLPYGKAWLSATSALSLIDPTVGRDIKLRVYSDYDSLRAYQLQGIRTLRDLQIG